MFFSAENLRKFNEKLSIIYYKYADIVEKYNYNDLAEASEIVTSKIQENLCHNKVIGIICDNVDKKTSIPLILG